MAAKRKIKTKAGKIQIWEKSFGFEYSHRVAFIPGDFKMEHLSEEFWEAIKGMLEASYDQGKDANAEEVKETINKFLNLAK